jgi:hypothetical protein
MRNKAFTQSQENIDALKRIVRARWKNIVKACKALGLNPGNKPAEPK